MVSDLSALAQKTELHLAVKLWNIFVEVMSLSISTTITFFIFKNESFENFIQFILILFTQTPLNSSKI